MILREELKQFYKNVIKDLNLLYEKIKQYQLISILFVIAVLLIILFPHWQVSGINNVTEKVTQENQSRATLAQVLGGVAIGIGLYYTWRRITIAEENLKVSQEGQITERFTRAVDQLGAIDHLGNPAIEIRLGGIYALERIASESDKDYWPIMEILTAYVRKNSSVDLTENKNVTLLAIDIQANESKQNEVLEIKKIALDIQAVLTVLGRREKSFNDGESNRLNLSRSRLQAADLEGAHLEGAHLMETHLEGANLARAYLERTDLVGSYLVGADLVMTHLEGADLRWAHLEGADLGGAYLKGADLEEAHLEGAYLIRTNLIEVNFKGANLGKMEFEDVKSYEVFANEADDVRLIYAGDKTDDKDFSKTELKGANLAGANLTMADLTGATLIETNLAWADLAEVNFTEAKLERANLAGAKNLTVDQLSKAKTLYQAELDPELEEELRSKGYSHLLDDEPEK